MNFMDWFKAWYKFNRIMLSLKLRSRRPPHLHTILATDGLLSIDEMQLLYDLAKEVSNSCIVEIGSFHGKSAVALSLGTFAGHKVPVYAIDPYVSFVGPLGGKFGPHDRVILLQNLLLAGVADSVSIINLKSGQASKGWEEVIGLLWIDGDHSYEGVKTDFECWSPFVIQGGVIAFHDSLDPNLGVLRLMDEILDAGQYVKEGIADRITYLRKR